MAHVIETVLGLMVAVAIVAVLARRLQVPYPILLVIGGLGLALVPGLPRVRLNPELVFLFFLPPLLYPAALFTSWRDFRADLPSISLLAVGLVLFTTVVIAWAAHALTGMPWAAGFVLGAIVSPPDALAATTIAHRLRLPRRIVTILEGESLVNDATALVAYRFGVAAVLSGGFSLAHATGRFFFVGALSVLFGLIVGWLAGQIHARLDDPPVQVTISLLTPFAAYLPADRLGLSGVLAVVTTGLYLGWRAPEIVNARMRLQSFPVWGMVQFLLNGVIFILIGLQLPEVVRNLAARSKWELTWHALAISAAVIAVRLVWVYSATWLRRIFCTAQEDRNPDWRRATIIGWTGMRGVVSLAAAMALPERLPNGAAFPARDLILFLTFSVIFATLVLQGLSLPAIIRWSNLEDDGEAEREEREARLKANEAALARLNELDASTDRGALDRLRAEYEDRIRQLQVFGNAGATAVGDGKRVYEALLEEALKTERRTILRLRNERVINDAVLRRIQRDLDLAEGRLKREET
ncbi:MAG TPA: Na+/H+ antiporter [Verrucomicrobiae bacterium]|nr:Na+/H+ antiporter [Verrucomicrobiae bacterium]